MIDFRMKLDSIEASAAVFHSGDRTVFCMSRHSESCRRLAYIVSVAHPAYIDIIC